MSNVKVKVIVYSAAIASASIKQATVSVSKSENPSVCSRLEG